ncbi:MAG: Gfo/Idh/MocA family protein [Opitutales bacterium]
MSKKRYAVVGTGGRCPMFIDPILGAHKAHCTLVGFCDISQVRMDQRNRYIGEKFGHEPVPTYQAEAFDRMVEETKPEVIIVTSKDDTHDLYIVRACELGCDAITEKPMTIDDRRCRRILDTVEQTGRNVRVTFNYRWGAFNTRVKEVLDSGVIGTVRSVNLEYLLNTSHGADYYRRWHSSMADCGGLLVHKSTHHFDLVNWWIDSIPEQVFAYGDLVFYGRDNAVRRGDKAYTGYPRYTGYVTKEQDPYSMDLSEGTMKALYKDAEEETGYIRDRNVFREGIDIYDTMSVNVRYRSGVLLTYSLNSFSPREGMRVTFNGDRGRVEYYEFGGSHIITGESSEDLAEQQAADPGQERIVVFPHFKQNYEVPVQKGEGGHGGGDPLIQAQIFSPEAPEETLGRNAGHEQGAASILIGVAANQSIVRNAPVRILDLAHLRPEAIRLSELT